MRGKRCLRNFKSSRFLSKLLKNTSVFSKFALLILHVQQVIDCIKLHRVIYLCVDSCDAFSQVLGYINYVLLLSSDYYHHYSLF